LTNNELVHPNRAVNSFRKACGVGSLVDDYVLMTVLMRACDEECLATP